MEGLSLFINPPAWGLPSYDVACSELFLYLKAARIPFTLHYSSYPDSSVTCGDSFPTLLRRDEPVSSHDCLDFVREHYTDLDGSRDELERADLQAYSSFVDNELSLLTLYLQYGQEEAIKVTRSVKYSDLSFPAREFLNTKEERFFKAYLYAKNFSSREKVLNSARSIYRSLASRLGSKDYFFGSLPSSLDIKVASALAFHVRFDLKDNPFRDLLFQKFPNLVQLVDRVLALGTEQEAVALPALRSSSSPSSASTSSSSSSKEDLESVALRRQNALFLFSGTFFSAIYLALFLKRK